MDHAILTRFNLPSAGSESVIRATSGWLTERVELFERYCLPSIRLQTMTSFGWLVYFDPDSPAWLKERIDMWATGGPMVPLFRTEVPRADLLSDIETHVGRSNDWLITTNLDNDDALAVDFAERVQSAPRSTSSQVIYLGNGLIREGNSVFAHRDPTNAFCSVREPWLGARTCWSEWHNLLPSMMPAEVLDGDPGWLQVVHGGNVTNRVRGRLIDAAPYHQLFPGLLSDLAAPYRSAILRDTLVDGPRRRSIEKVRQVGKSTILRLAGKQGLDRVKQVLANLRA